jgi:WD40 repeat protein
VRKLSYCPQFGGFLVSVGYEVIANVWGPEAMVSNIHLGKLRGHSRPLIATKFLGKSAFNITIDEKNEIRIWDVRSCTCHQTINAKLHTTIQGLLCFDNNIFWVYGKRFI